MRVTVRLFARLREIAGTGDLECEIEDSSNARALWDRLTADFPALADYTPIISCAVNEEYAGFDRRLQDGDEVAFLPPVSGGERPQELQQVIRRISFENRKTS